MHKARNIDWLVPALATGCNKQQGVMHVTADVVVDKAVSAFAGKIAALLTTMSGVTCMSPAVAV